MKGFFCLFLAFPLLAAPTSLETGLRLARSGDFQKAALEFEAVFRREPHNDQARFLYAVSLVRLHRNRADLLTAERLLLASIQQHERMAAPGPSDDLNLRHGTSRPLALRYTYLGLVRRARLDRMRALDSFKAAEHWDPGFEEAFLNRLALLRELGRAGEIPFALAERRRESPKAQTRK
jgi:tetratricopeptide (TPR) repeat protein